jgi:hypothetical protein
MVRSAMAKDYVELREDAFYIANSRLPLFLLVTEYENGASPEEIHFSFPSLTLEQIHGAIAFYLANRQVIEDGSWQARKAWQDFRTANPAPSKLDLMLENYKQQSQRKA